MSIACPRGTDLSIHVSGLHYNRKLDSDFNRFPNSFVDGASVPRSSLLGRSFYFQTVPVLGRLAPRCIHAIQCWYVISDLAAAARPASHVHQGRELASAESQCLNFSPVSSRLIFMHVTGSLRRKELQFSRCWRCGTKLNSRKSLNLRQNRLRKRRLVFWQRSLGLLSRMFLFNCYEIGSD